MSHEMREGAQHGQRGALVLILLLVMLLGGIGLGGYWVIGQRQQAAVQAAMQAREAARAAQEAAAAAEAQRKAKAP